MQEREKEKVQEPASEDGFVFDEEGDLTAYIGTSKNVRIPSRVERLPNNLFKKNESIEEVVIPRTVKFVGSSCFKGCKSLKKVTFEADVNSIPVKCFKNCRSLTEFKINAPIRKISMEAFMNCASLEEITLDQQIRTIGISAFNGCNNLKKVTEVNGVVTYDHMCFKNTDLTEIEFIRTRTIGAYAFSGTKLTNIVIPSTCTSIKVGAFYRCQELESVRLKSDMAMLEFNAFGECDKLKSVMFDDVVAIQGLAAFHKLENLDAIVVTKDSKPFIGFSSLLVTSNPAEESNGKVLFDVGLAADMEGSVSLMLTQNQKEMSDGLTLNELNKCMKYLKDPTPKRLESIKNRQLHLSSMCAMRIAEEITEYPEFLYCYQYTHLTGDTWFFIELCKANENNLDRSMIIDLSKEVIETEVREYLLSLISIADYENQTTNFSSQSDFTPAPQPISNGDEDLSDPTPAPQLSSNGEEDLSDPTLTASNFNSIFDAAKKKKDEQQQALNESLNPPTSSTANPSNPCVPVPAPSSSTPNTQPTSNYSSNPCVPVPAPTAQTVANPGVPVPNTSKSKPVVDVNKKATNNITKAAVSGGMAGAVGGVEGVLAGAVVAGAKTLASEVKDGNVQINVPTAKEVSSTIKNTMGNMKAGKVSTDDGTVNSYYENNVRMGLVYVSASNNLAFAILNGAVDENEEIELEMTQDTRSGLIYVDGKIYPSPVIIRQMGGDYVRMKKGINVLPFIFKVDKNVENGKKFTKVCGAKVTSQNGKFIVVRKGALTTDNPVFDD
jgi:hypothetical protein